MRRALIPIVAAVALALPSTANAFFSEFYSGPVAGGQGTNAGVEFKAHFANKRAFQNGKPPRKVANFHWFNVLLQGGVCADSLTDNGFNMDVNDEGRFHGTLSVSGTDHKATVHGKFKHQNKKAAGTIRVHGGHFSGGCVPGDTGLLDWVAHRGGSD